MESFGAGSEEEYEQNNEGEENEQNYEEEKNEETNTNQNVSFHFPNNERTSINDDENHTDFQHQADDDLGGPTPFSNQSSNKARDDNPFLNGQPMSDMPNLRNGANLDIFSRIKDDSSDDDRYFNRNRKPFDHHDWDPFDHHDMMNGSLYDEDFPMHRKAPHSERHGMEFDRRKILKNDRSDIERHPMHTRVPHGDRHGMGMDRSSDSSDDEMQPMHGRVPHSNHHGMGFGGMGFGGMGFGGMGFGGMGMDRSSDSSDDEMRQMHARVPRTDHYGMGFGGMGMGMGFGGMGMGFGGMGRHNMFDRSGPRSEPRKHEKPIIRNFDQKTPEDIILPFYDLL